MKEGEVGGSDRAGSRVVHPGRSSAVDFLNGQMFWCRRRTSRTDRHIPTGGSSMSVSFPLAVREPTTKRARETGPFLSLVRKGGMRAPPSVECCGASAR